jgi:hypothetical protein
VDVGTTAVRIMVRTSRASDWNFGQTIAAEAVVVTPSFTG